MLRFFVFVFFPLAFRPLPFLLVGIALAVSLSRALGISCDGLAVVY